MYSVYISRHIEQDVIQVFRAWSGPIPEAVEGFEAQRRVTGVVNFDMAQMDTAAGYAALLRQPKDRLTHRTFLHAKPIYTDAELNALRQRRAKRAQVDG